MSTFLVTMLIVCCLENVARVIWLTMASPPQCSKGSVAIDLIMGMALIAWIVVLMVKT